MRRWISGRLRGGEFLLGCFVATPLLSTCEVLGACGFDVLVADAEHAPLGPPTSAPSWPEPTSPGFRPSSA